MKPHIVTKLPGPQSQKIIRRLKQVNGAINSYYPFAMSGQGSGVYFKDVDGNTFLDFASQVASTPLGYNHPRLKEVIKEQSKQHPVKYAGQDFNLKIHADFIEELLSVCKGMNRAFLVNSGAEAVENCIKIAMRSRPRAKFGVSFDHAFHGRTLGALSLTHSKAVHKKNYFTIPTKTLSFSDRASVELERLIKRQGASSIAFVILEHVQGEGGYNPASKKMVQEVRRLCATKNIPYIADEVQAGMGRTGEWWAFQHYNIKPDAFSAAKALQVGATVSTKKLFPKEGGAISSTWGGGQIIDLAVGLETIKIIKRKHLLAKNKSNGKYLLKQLQSLPVVNTRGLGLMVAFDLPTAKKRDAVIKKSLQQGLVMLACGPKGIRLIPPYIVSRNEIDQAVSILENSM